MDAKIHGKPWLRSAGSALVALALGALCAPAMAGADLAHAATSFSALSGSGAAADSDWSLPSERVFASRLEQRVVDVSVSPLYASPIESSSHPSFSQEAEDHRNRDGAGFEDHGGWGGSRFDDGQLGEGHLCDECRAAPPSAVPELSAWALMLGGCAAVVFGVRRRAGLLARTTR